MLTDTQLQTLATALRAEPSIAALVTARNDYGLAEWCNAASTQDAWNPTADARTMFEAMDVTKFDQLTAGKRDAWRVMLDNAPIDFSRNKMRKAVEDEWGADAGTVLAGLVRKATNGERALGGTVATTAGVSAWKLDFVGSIAINEVSQALNRF